MTDAGAQPAAAPTPVAGPMPEAQAAELARAGKRWKKVRRAASVSRFSAWTLGLFAAVSLLIGISDVQAAIIGVLLGMVCIIEFRGSAILGRAEERGAVLLAWNQILLMGLIIVYCVYKAFFAEHQSLVSDPQVADLLGDAETRAALEAQVGSGLTSLIDPSNTASLVRGFYLIVALAAMLTQGLMSLYYIDRRRVVREYLAATPAWVVQVHRHAT